MISDSLEKWFPLQGERAHSLKLKLQSQSKLNPIHFFALLSSSVSRANLSCAVAIIFSSLAFLSLSVSMANLSRLVATIFSSLALLSSSISTANLATSLGYPDLFRIPEGKVWALSCANRLTLECRNLTAGLC